jgi:site-specific DNA-methyltransferase (adenine-specific)
LSTEEGDLVLDPFMGSGTTALVSQELNRKWIGFEIDEKYSHITKERVSTNVTPEQLAQHPSNLLLDAL